MSFNAPVTPKRALISVSDKSGIVDFAKILVGLNIEILSTGGTYRLLKDNSLPVIEVSEHTGFPEMMDGRVKTLHPKIHGGILARRGTDDAILTANDISPIDIIVVNLYPFSQTVAKQDCSLEDAVENIDIGGPTMLRAAAKNHNHVTVVVNSSDYSTLEYELKENSGAISYQTRFDLAIKAFEHTAAYDGAIANHFGKLVEGGSDNYPRTFNTQFIKVQELRYGENPHQTAAVYKEAATQGTSISTAKQLQGKELSYNNIADTDAALETVKLFEEPACVIVKHANPCGVACASTVFDAYSLAFETDPESAFGGIIAFNRELDQKTATVICDKQFVEVIIAPSAHQDAIATVAQKKNVRLLITGPLAPSQQAFDYKRIIGGLLVQDSDQRIVTLQDLTVVSARQPTTQELEDMIFTWKVAKMVKSNAIVYGKDKRTIGVGAGQMSRINSARIAAIKAEHAGLNVKGACMASDAFFPFRDGIDNAANVGIECIIQPGGSIRDEEIIAAANEHNMAMVFTGVRHFRH